jgi:hypothetical protein
MFKHSCFFQISMRNIRWLLLLVQNMRVFLCLDFSGLRKNFDGNPLNIFGKYLKPNTSPCISTHFALLFTGPYKFPLKCWCLVVPTAKHNIVSCWYLVVPTAEHNIISYWYLVVPAAEHNIVSYWCLVVPTVEHKIVSYWYYLCPKLNTILSHTDILLCPDLNTVLF